jgi:hypothetical protein
MALLSRDQILQADVAPTLEPVPVPEWGGEGAEVLVGVLSGKQRDRFEAAYNASKSKDQTRSLLAAFAIRDADNKQLFTEADVAQLGETSGIALDRVFKAAFRVNRMGDEALAETVGE